MHFMLGLELCKETEANFLHIFNILIKLRFVIWKIDISLFRLSIEECFSGLL